MDAKHTCSFCGRWASLFDKHLTMPREDGGYDHMLCYHERAEPQTWMRRDEDGVDRPMTAEEAVSHREWARQTYTKPT